MAEYTVTTDADEEEALQWVATSADPPQDAATYFDARMHDVLHSYVQQHAVATAVAPVDEVATEYAKASTQQQADVANILGVQVTKPA